MAHTSETLSQLLPVHTSRFGEAEGTASGAALEDGLEKRAERRERRRAANTTNAPDGDRLSPVQSPGKNSPRQAGQPREGTPTRSGNPGRHTDGGDADMSRYGLVEIGSETGDRSTPPSPTAGSAALRGRRRLGSGVQDRSAGRRPESPSPSETGGASAAHRASSETQHSEIVSTPPYRRGLRSFTRAHSGQISDSGAQGRPSGHVTEEVLAAAADAAADMHIIGEIVGGSRFQHKALFCRWQLVYNASTDSGWRVVRGAQRGSSQVSSCASRDDDMVTWEHPIDLHLKTHSLVAWPSLMFTVYSFDDLAQKEALVSTGICPLPNTPGVHHLSCRTWCAYDDATVEGNRLFGWFTGIQPPQDQTFVIDTKCREDAGPFRCTIGSGQVHLRLQLLFRHMSRLRHAGGESLFSALQRLHEQAAAQRLKGRKVEDVRRSAAAAKGERPERSEGLRLVQEGREARFKVVQDQLDRRAGGGHSPTSSEAGSRSRSVDAMARPSALRRDSRTSSVSAPREDPRSGPLRGGGDSSSQWNTARSPRTESPRSGNTGRAGGSRDGDGSFNSGYDMGPTIRDRTRDEQRSPRRDLGGRMQDGNPQGGGSFQQGSRQENDTRPRGRDTDWSRGADREQGRPGDGRRESGVGSYRDGGRGSVPWGPDRAGAERGRGQGLNQGPESPVSRGAR